MNFFIAAFFLMFPIWLAMKALQKAWLDSVRQELFRVRNRIYDRVRSKELSMQDESVEGIIRYIHALINVLDKWDFIVCFTKLRNTPKEKFSLPWTKDERLKTESRIVLKNTVKGLFFASGLIRMAFAILLPLAWIKGKADEFKVDLSGRVSSAFKGEETTIPAC